MEWARKFLELSMVLSHVVGALLAIQQNVVGGQGRVQAVLEEVGLEIQKQGLEERGFPARHASRCLKSEELFYLF
jgi:hypothetical protein